MDDKIVQIGKEVVTRFFAEPDETLWGFRPERTEFSIFLCGGRGSTPASLRKPLRDRIVSKVGKYKYRVYYPEVLFTDLVLGHQRQSLLTLENLLARSVGAIGIIVESPGTLVELGAFANHEALSEKLIVILDEEYKSQHSFVNLGPIRHLKRSKTSYVIHHSFVHPNFDWLSEVVCSATRRISKAYPPVRNLSNAVEAMRVYLALVQVLEPVRREELISLATILAEADPDILNAASTAVNALISEGHMTETVNGLSVSPAGVAELLSGRKGIFWPELDYLQLGQLRMKAMNLRLRRSRNGGAVHV